MLTPKINCHDIKNSTANYGNNNHFKLVSPSQYFETLLNVDQTRGQRDVKDENSTVSHDASAVHSSPQPPAGGSGHAAEKTG